MIGFGCFLGAIVYFAMGSAQVYIGFHAFDSGHNAAFLFNELGQRDLIGGYCDKTLGGTCIPLTNLYMHGLSLAAEGYWNLISGFVIGMFGLGTFLLLYLCLLVEWETIEKYNPRMHRRKQK